MTLPEAVADILSSVTGPITPQEIREAIKNRHPQFYGTPAQIRNVKAGHYKDLDHALLAHIYSTIRAHKRFFCDNTSKPIKVSLEACKSIRMREKPEVPYSRDKFSSIINPEKLAQRITDVLANLEKYHDAYYEAEVFRRPSRYFHQRALETRRSPTSLTHLEYVYATLASWGMHRMGKNGSKMQSFDVFRRSAESIGDRLVEAQAFDYRKMTERNWMLLKDIFMRLTVMASGTSLVGNSKVMHHTLPNIVPPVDREYTLWYLLGNKSIKNDLDGEWELLRTIISDFFIPVASSRELEAASLRWIGRNDQYPWDTSVMKIVDNLVIGSKKVKS